MGHTRKAAEAPSPLQLLAIFSAKETGMPILEISARTKYAKSSIIRWWEKWGHEMAFYEAVKCECPNLLAEWGFETWWPDESKSAAVPHLSIVSDNDGI